MSETRLWLIGFAALALICLFAITVGFISAPTTQIADDRKVGVYYYVWYGLNTSVRNTAGAFHSNWEYASSAPFVGEYASNDSVVADTQIILAKLHKIDFFAVSWLGNFDWYDHLAINDFLQQGLLKAEHINTFNFCIFYESDIVLNSVYDKQNHTGLEGMNATDFFERVFSNDTNYAAEQYFNNPSYLRIDDKPVLFLYDLPNLCENLTTQTVHSMLADLRSRLSNDIYLVADVGHGPLPANITSFQLSDFSDVLNATTNYFFSSPSKSWNEILDDAQQDYPQWRANMTEEGMSFFPSAYPGYNDSIENPNSPVLQVNATEFGEFFQVARDNTDNGGITMITSWNEWKESTAIEPSVELGDLLLDVVPIVPEFPSPLVLLVILVLTTPSVVVYRKWARQRNRP
jgi:hypothetical protein